MFPFQFNTELFNQRTQTQYTVRRIPEYIEIKDPATDKPVAFLSPDGDGLKECWIDNELNGECKLDFELPLNSDKWLYIDNQYRVYAGGREFVFAASDVITKERDGQRKWGRVSTHESWVLLGKKYKTISNDPQNQNPPWSAVIIVSGGNDLSGGRHAVGSAGHALYALLQGSGWTVGVVDVGGTFDLESEKESVLANIKKVQELWGGYLVWDSIKKTVSLRSESTWQNYTGFGARYAKNLKSITRIDDRNITTKLYPFGADDLNIGSVNGGVIYLTNTSFSSEELVEIWVNQDINTPQALKDAATDHLAKICKPRHKYSIEIRDLRTISGYEHETFDIGHLIDLADEELGIEDRARIIRHRYNVFQPWQNQIDVGDPIEKIAASIVNSIKAADFIKSSVKPNSSFQNLLKSIINTAATEINGASGDYTLINGVSTWSERVSGTLTGKILRITPEGLIISSDGGQTWDLAIDGESINASMINTGTMNAAIVNILSNNGKFKIEDKGLKIYDADDKLRVHIGEYATGKYGIKVIGGEIYSSMISTGTEGATSNYLRMYNDGNSGVISIFGASGEEILRITSTGEQAIFRFMPEQNYGAGAATISNGASNKLYLSCSTGIELQGTTNVTGDLNLSGGTKYNVEQTKNYGQRKLTVRESPSEQYVDEGIGVLTNGVCHVQIDPIFMECIETNIPNSKWHIHLTPYADIGLYIAEIGINYFVVKEQGNGTTTGAEFSWSLSATRKNYAGIRLMEVVG